VRAAALFLAGTIGTALLAWLGIGVNLERACSTGDTPYLDLCSVQVLGSPAHLAALRSRIARNPGDTNAYVQLALAEPPAARNRALDAASKLAPGEPNVLTARAAAALDRQDWRGAIPVLVQLTEYRDKPQAALVLARMIASGQGALLSPYLTPGSQWFARVLAQMSQVQAPFSTALPLVVQALRLDVLDSNTVLGFVRQLKANGAWVDAYSLWLSLHRKPLPLLYNGSFDDGFQLGGFDWELGAAGPASRTGAIVERRGAQERGAVLDIQFTGRAIQLPLVRQYLFLGEGKYRLQGEYEARQLRTEHGLAWTVTCPAGQTQAGKSDALGDTAAAWRPFSFEFSVPPGCGQVVSRQLETDSPSQAALGARGRIAFDAFSLEKLAR
jgi:hypothetical protein